VTDDDADVALLPCRGLVEGRGSRRRWGIRSLGLHGSGGRGDGAADPCGWWQVGVARLAPAAARR
jgi:hypothetical protein